MFSQIGLAFASCVAISGCSYDQISESDNYLQKISPTYQSQIFAQVDVKTLGEQQSGVFKNRVKEKVSYIPQQLDSGNYMALRKTGETNEFDNPIYELQLFVQGQKIDSYRTVSGRSNTQNRDRHVSGTEAPLPNGRYSVSRDYVPGTHPEVGGRFLPIYPKFSTGRSALGIHYDPSFNISQKDDGTAGCLALTNVSDLDLVLKYVQKYQPRFLDVQV